MVVVISGIGVRFRLLISGKSITDDVVCCVYLQFLRCGKWNRETRRSFSVTALSSTVSLTEIQTQLSRGRKMTVRAHFSIKQACFSSNSVTNSV